MLRDYKTNCKTVAFRNVRTVSEDKDMKLFEEITRIKHRANKTDLTEYSTGQMMAIVRGMNLICT